MSFQTDAEAIAASSTSTATTTSVTDVTTTTIATNAFSVEALGDAAGTTSMTTVSTPDFTGKAVSVTVAGTTAVTGSTTIQLNGNTIVTISNVNGNSLAFVLEIICVSTSGGKFNYTVSSAGSSAAGFNVSPVSSTTSDSLVGGTISVVNASSVSQLTAKLA